METSSIRQRWKLNCMELFSRRKETERMKQPQALPKIDQNGVGARLDALRLALDLPKGEFASSFGLDPSSYAKIISGDKPLKSEHAFAISERWGVSMDFLYRGRFLEMPADLRLSILSFLNSQD